MSKTKRTIFWVLLIHIFAVGLTVVGVKLYKRKKTHHIVRTSNRDSGQTNHSGYVFGIDVSHHQSNINWHKVRTSKHDIKFVFVRASYGAFKRDRKFKRNWQALQKEKYLKGAYHYFKPNQSGASQWHFFDHIVELKKGDFPPVLDIEDAPSNPSAKNIRRWKKDLKTWADLAEKKYGKKPIIYSGRKFYETHLKTLFPSGQYPLWVAQYPSKRAAISYSTKSRIRHLGWKFHQFSDRIGVKGIPVGTFADGNDFNGTMQDLKALTL
ncbi:glycoside hydrolase family 25 protein [Persicobacter psychrovividus]|uniref:Glycosyl hydrolase n=1 Tax=Persicobacter psychrovividus TaxID=387638 RepID=A0ABM7VHC8_9BACT|nr:glycosyl hydrolase [Persicobacter psychrovividus]